MLHALIDSWPLFGNTYLTAWAMAALLGLTGVPVVARDQIFVGAAITQAAMLGIALALWARYLPWAADAAWLGGPAMLTGLAVGFGIVTTLLTTRGSRTGETTEGRTGWLYLGAGSLTIVLLARSPVGLNEIDQRLASSVIGAEWPDVALTAGLLAVVVLLAAWLRRPLTLVITDPPMATAVGLRTARWEVGLALALGIVLGASLRTGGMLYSFGCLVLPGLVARYLCRETRTMFLAAPLAGLAAAVAGFTLGNGWDVPPAPLSVLLLAAALPLAKTVAILRARS